MPAVWTVELWVIVAAVTAKLESGEPPPPTAPVKVKAPDPAARVVIFVPVNVELKVISPLFDVRRVVPVKNTGKGNVNELAPLVVMLLPT